MPKSKTYDGNLAKGRKPDGHDNGAGGPVPEDRKEELGEGVPYWYIDDPQGDIPDEGEDADT